MKKIIFGLMILIIVLPLINADLIVPGYSPIEINNKITNIDDYPDYVFIVSIDGKVSNSLINDELNLVGGDGVIETPYYKFETVSVYALEKSKFNGDYLKGLNLEEFNIYLEKGGVKVIGNVPHYKTRSVSDTVKVENNEYSINLTNVATIPTNTKVERDSLIYFYIGIPIISLIIILIILIRKYKKWMIIYLCYLH